MSKKTDIGVPVRTPHQDLAKEAAEWSDGTRTPQGWADAPDAVPIRVGQSKVSRNNILVNWTTAERRADRAKQALAIVLIASGFLLVAAIVFLTLLRFLGIRSIV
jgi:hypothetical protein